MKAPGTLAAVHAVLFMAAFLAGSCLLSCLLDLSQDMVRRRRARRQPTPVHVVDQFLNRILFRGETEGIRYVTLSIDVFLFDFRGPCPDGLDKDVQYRFLDYMRTLDLRDMRAVTKLYIWLKQNGVAADLRFKWNRNLPMAYNWSRRRWPKELKRRVDNLSLDTLMAYDLSKDPYALHP